MQTDFTFDDRRQWSAPQRTTPTVIEPEQRARRTATARAGWTSPNGQKNFPHRTMTSFNTLQDEPETGATNLPPNPNPPTEPKPH